MDVNQVNQLMMVLGNKLPETSLQDVRQRLEMAQDFNSANMVVAQMKDPTTAIILSVLLGSLGVDRFFIGDIGLGVGKLLTAGGCGIWSIIDWFMIMGATKEKNLQLLLNNLR